MIPYILFIVIATKPFLPYMDEFLNYGVLGIFTGISFYILMKIFAANNRERINKENKNDILEQEFRSYIAKNNTELLNVIKEYSAAFDRNTKAIERMSSINVELITLLKNK